MLAHGRDVDPEPFAGRIVIIGSSAGYRDFVQTPLKRMPGALAHANAIHAWLAFGPDPGINYWRGALFVVPFTALAALLVVLAIFSLPRRFRPAARTARPFVMTTLLACLSLVRRPSASVGLLVSLTSWWRSSPFSCGTSSAFTIPLHPSRSNPPCASCWRSC